MTPCPYTGSDFSFLPGQRVPAMPHGATTVLTAAFLLGILTREPLVAGGAAAVKLALYYRGGEGQPLIPAPSRLPPAFPNAEPPDSLRLEADIEDALGRRPDLARPACGASGGGNWRR